MPTLNVDDEVFAALQKRAVPLVDTANDVLRRILLLGENGELPAVLSVTPSIRVAPASLKKRSRKFGEGMPMTEYRPYILRALMAEGGRAHLSKVKDFIRRRLGHRFDSHDLDYTQSNAIVWENRVEWQRLVMRQDGLIAPDSPRGVWELSQKGIEEAKKVTLPGD